MKFPEYPYERPNEGEISAQYDKLIEDFKNATDFSSQLAVFQRYEAMEKEIGTMGTIAHVRFTINTKEPFYKEECDFFDAWGPVLAEKDLVLTKMLLASPFLEDFRKELGDVAIGDMELSVKSFSPEVTELKQKENELTTKYQALYASATVEFDGKAMPLPLLGPYKISPDRAVRKDAYAVEGKFFDDNQAELDEIFDALVKNRTEQAKILGYDNYVDLAYVRRSRNCYNAPDVAKYRAQILSDVVPLVSNIKENQKKRIGLTDFKFYDDGFLFPDGNPTPQGTPEELMAHCKTMYQEMSPETSKFINFMFDNELFDVISRDGKAPGGYCTTFSKYGAPFIFSNFNGTAGDVDVLTHEAGHALAAFQAQQYKYSCQQHPTSDACEVHSMAMEYLTSPWHHLFFKEDTAKYTLNQAESDLAFLPYGTMVDYFQELIYKNPDWTPQERNQQWASLERQFRPHLDMEGLPFYGRGAGWQRQLHIYLYPFYYIDYCLASTVALQIQAMKLGDSAKAWDTYLKYTNLAYTHNFLGLVKQAGLQSPMDQGCLKNICDVISKWWSEIKDEV